METGIINPYTTAPAAAQWYSGFVRLACEHAFVYRRYDVADFEAVKHLVAAGHSDYAIGRMLSFPRSTVQRFRHSDEPPGRYPAIRRKLANDWSPPHAATYAYLLGIYLGDGYLSRNSPAGWRLIVTLDRSYPALIDEVQAAIEATDPRTTVCRNQRPGATLLAASSILWPAAFPQHGPGRKHERPIELVEWQRGVTHEHPKSLLRGLIQSDGSRCMNRFKTRLPSGRVADYAYPRYFFTNVSADIRRIFCEHCELLGIRWTRSSWRNISVSHRDSVALADTFIGPKT